MSETNPLKHATKNQTSDFDKSINWNQNAIYQLGHAVKLLHSISEFGNVFLINGISYVLP